jgi:hypothetical protein
LDLAGNTTAWWQEESARGAELNFIAKFAVQRFAATAAASSSDNSAAALLSFEPLFRRSLIREDELTDSRKTNWRIVGH